MGTSHVDVPQNNVKKSVHSDVLHVTNFSVDPERTQQPLPVPIKIGSFEHKLLEPHCVLLVIHHLGHGTDHKRNPDNLFTPNCLKILLMKLYHVRVDHVPQVQRFPCK